MNLASIYSEPCSAPGRLLTSSQPALAAAYHSILVRMTRLRHLLFAGLLLVSSAYLGTAWALPVAFRDATPGLTTFTVPETGLYDIFAEGAQGGASASVFRSNAGGFGAAAGGGFLLTAGEALTIAVGELGINGSLTPFGNTLISPLYDNGAGGGGGGSFVVGPNGTPLVVAGGGGGGGDQSDGGSGQATTAGQGSLILSEPSYTSRNGGNNGSGGVGSNGGGGGGFLTAGGPTNNFFDNGGAAYPSLFGGNGVGSGGRGGFGGGGGGGTGDSGSGGHSAAGGGGGGGYSGGGGGSFSGDAGGGGGSFNAATSDGYYVLLAGANAGNGSVTITELEANPVPEPASFALLGFGLVGLAGARWRTR